MFFWQLCGGLFIAHRKYEYHRDRADASKVHADAEDDFSGNADGSGIISGDADCAKGAVYLVDLVDGCAIAIIAAMLAKKLISTTDSAFLAVFGWILR